MNERRVCLVTGGTRGLGAAVSLRMASAGVDVVAVYQRDESAAARLVEAAGGLPGDVSTVRADLEDRGACRQLIAATVAAHGRLDHLVNNAGLLLESKPVDTTDEEWDRAFAVNLSAPWFLAQAALEPMLAQSFGRIVNVSSVTAVMGSAVEVAYGAAKAGLLGMTRSLARAVARKGITVNCIIPCIFETDMTRSMDPRAQEAIRALIPLGRRGDPDELAHAVAFLLDDRAGYVTGSVVTVDGGLSMGG